MGLYPGKYSVAGQAEGDCSLTVHDVDIKLDDGEWQCQVTATSYNSQDALASSGQCREYTGTRLGTGYWVTRVHEYKSKRGGVHWYSIT